MNQRKCIIPGSISTQKRRKYVLALFLRGIPPADSRLALSNRVSLERGIVNYAIIHHVSNPSTVGHPARRISIAFRRPAVLDGESVQRSSPKAGRPTRRVLNPPTADHATQRIIRSRDAKCHYHITGVVVIPPRRISAKLCMSALPSGSNGAL